MSAGAAAYIGVGGNLHRPAYHVRLALVELGQFPMTSRIACSRLYRSRPLGPGDQPDFINAVVRLETRLEPLALLHALTVLELRHGRERERERHWGPRILDLDLLLYGEQRMNTPDLILPHPGLHARSFVLYPLAEVAPTLMIPGHGPVQALRDRCQSPAIRLYEESDGE